MKLPLLSLLLLAPLPLAAMTAEDHFRTGEAALGDELWEVAAIHFSDLLETKGLPPAEKSRAAIHLAEAWIRGGQPKQALDLLNQSYVTGASGYHFWKGQALAGLGRFAEAAKELLLDTEFQVEAAFTRCSLLLSLNQPDEALDAIHPLSLSLDPAVAVDARLREVEILIELQRFAEARKTIPALTEIPESQATQASFLEACLLLHEKKAADAAERFATLLTRPAGQTRDHYHAAALGYADALAAQGDLAKASDSLLLFVQDHPSSPLLAGIFQRLLDWLPAEPPLNHPTLVRLEPWQAPAIIPLTGIIATGTNATGAWPVAVPPNELAVYAMYTRALGLHRIPDPIAQESAKLLLTRLQLEYPQHPMASKAMLEMARWLMAEGDAARATALFDAVRQSAPPALGGEAAFLKAESAFKGGDFPAAAQLFDEASRSLPGAAGDSSRLNSAISRLRKGDTITVALTGADGKPVDNPGLKADLELEQALAAKPAAAARVAIEDFLTRNPKHPRVPEARLAAAEAALAIIPPDLSMARAQLDTISAEPGAADALPPAKLALARLKLTDLAGDAAATKLAASSFREKFPDDPAVNDASFILGSSLYKSENYNEAHIVLQKLAESDGDSARAQAAWLLAARSASLVATPQSREEALALFDHAIAGKGPLEPFAMMEKANLMIALNRLPEAIAFLRKWYNDLPPADPYRIPAGLLFGEATYAQAGKDPAALTEALAVYDQLLKHPETKPALTNRIQYLRGMTLEQLPKGNDPTKKRDAEALDAYYSVLNNATTPPAEMHYLERSGFRALELLVKAERWPAAMLLAKKIASFNGPRAEEASRRASDIQLKNQIWDEPDEPRKEPAKPPK